MLTLQFYEAEHASPTTADELAAALLTIPGVAFDAPPSRTADHAAYRPAQWHDQATGARAHWDLGRPPLTASDTNSATDDRPRTYPGWRQVALELHVPFAGPHWHAVVALAQVDRLLIAAPQLTPLDTEDDRHTGDSDAGPYPWDRPRAIANWEILRAVQIADVAVPRLSRASSVALWRYRSERAAGRLAHPTYQWPEALALHDLDTNAVRTACLWPDATGDSMTPFALPPVDLVVIRGGVVPTDELRLIAGNPAAERVPGGARLIPASAAVSSFYAGAKTLPTSRFRGLGDEDWAD